MTVGQNLDLSIIICLARHPILLPTGLAIVALVLLGLPKLLSVCVDFADEHNCLHYGADTPDGPVHILLLHCVGSTVDM